MPVLLEPEEGFKWFKMELNLSAAIMKGTMSPIQSNRMKDSIKNWQITYCLVGLSNSGVGCHGEQLRSSPTRALRKYQM